MISKNKTKKADGCVERFQQRRKAKTNIFIYIINNNITKCVRGDDVMGLSNDIVEETCCMM